MGGPDDKIVFVRAGKGIQLFDETGVQPDFHAEPDAKPAVVFKACSEKIVNIRICIQKKSSLGSVLRDRIPHIHMLRESDVGKSSLQSGFCDVFHGLRTVSGKGRVQMLIS